MAALTATPSALTSALFKGADKNTSGTLSRAEFAKLAPAVTGESKPTATQTAAAFNALDADSSNTLSLPELAQATFSTTHTLSPRLQANLQAYSALTQTSGGNSRSSSLAAALYESLAPTISTGALTAALVSGSLTRKNLIA